MPNEIERKFLVQDLSIIAGRVGIPILQGYIASSIEYGGMLVRVRRAGDQAFITAKGPRAGISCKEWEFSIPVEEAIEMLRTFSITGLIEKTRYLVPVGAHTFEVDVFAAELDGLVIAEVELTDEAEHVELPAWLGREVSADLAYANVCLATTIFTQGVLPAFT